MTPNDNILASILKAAKRKKAKAFLLENGRPTLRFDELDPRTGSLAARLLDLGARPGDRLLVQTEKSPEAVLLYLACLRAGLVYVPLNTAYTAAELSNFIDDADPAVIVCDPSKEDAVRAAAGGRSVATLAESGAGSLLGTLPDHVVPIAHRDGADLACILYTSGTTGRSKGAMLTHRNLLSNAETLNALWRWTGDDVLIHILPIYHVHGLFVALHGALLAGATVRFHRSFDPARVIADLPCSTVFMGVPTHYFRLLAQPALSADVCASMRLFISGSAPLSSDTHRSFARATTHQILERYGMTETGIITSNPYEGERRPGTVGFPLPEVEVRIADDQGRVLAPGITGMLEVRGPNVFAGYWRNPAKTAEEFRPDGYFKTGDLAVQSVDGRVMLVGRAKDLIISGGLNVYPKEVEEAIDAIADVRESAVIGVPHPDWGEAVVAVVSVSSSEQLSLGAVQQALSGRLARFKHPLEVVTVEALPRNAMGKVQKSILRDRYQALFASSSVR